MLGVNSLPKTVTRQRRDCDFNPDRSVPESSTLTTRLPSHPNKQSNCYLLLLCSLPATHTALMAASASNVAPPSLRRKAATGNILQIIEAHPNWPVYTDVFEHPPPRLASRCPIWSYTTSVNNITQWREDWSSASVVNYTIVTDLTNERILL